MAFTRVETDGLPQQAYKYSANSFVEVSFLMIALTAHDEIFVISSGLSETGIETSHRPSRRLRRPAMMHISFLKILKKRLSSAAVQPSSHNCPMERSEEFVKLSKICAFVAVGDNEEWSGMLPSLVL